MLDFNEKIDHDLTYAVDFIREALKELPDYLEVETGEETEEPLILNKDLQALDFKEILLPQKEGSGVRPKVAAVDGGSATILISRSFRVGVFRAGYLIFQDKKRIEEKVLPLKLETVAELDRQEKFRTAFQLLTGEIPTRAPELDKLLDRLREMVEWQLVLELIEKLEAGDILLIDGSLRASIMPPYTLLDYVTQEAMARGIHLIGITKTSTLYWGKRSPLIPMVVKLAQHYLPDKRWYCRLSDLNTEPSTSLETDFASSNWFGTINVCRYSPAGDYGFRTDVSRLEVGEPQAVFGQLAALSNDPLFAGYPYPLAAIHQGVRILPAEKQDLRYRLQDKALQRGIATADWDLLFRDFHDILNFDLQR